LMRATQSQMKWYIVYLNMFRYRMKGN